MTTSRSCKDCLAETLGNPTRVRLRPAPYPGPRCATHHRVAALYRKKRAQEQRRQQVYGLSPEDHAALLALQGGACAICQRAKGIARALAVDHDHAQARRDGHDPEKGCPRCLRGLLCKSCNRMLGRMRDDEDTFRRAADYLRHPPAWDLAVRGGGSAPSASASAGSGSASPGSSASPAWVTASSDPRT